VTHSERRAQKLGWWIAAGYRLGEEIDSVTVINFLSGLTSGEHSLSDARFYQHVERRCGGQVEGLASRPRTPRVRRTCVPTVQVGQEMPKIREAEACPGEGYGGLLLHNVRGVRPGEGKTALAVLPSTPESPRTALGAA
jgi:hypothetical protein